jgi:serine/threonine-protein kinase
MEQRRSTPPPSSPPAKLSAIPAGTLVGGRYKIQQVLGQGGFGRSYLVTDTQRFDEASVLKEFVPLNQSPHLLQKAVDMFKREAKVLYQINHPQIPKFLASFTQSKRLFIVQEYINGITYAQLLKQRQQQGQLFSEAEVIQWLRQLLPVLDYLHRLNLIHRDISPDNIMFSRDRGLPVLIDFGLVKDFITWSATSEAGEYISQTSRLGKFGYSPPEQLHMGHCYPCSDLYALGVTAVVLMTGKHPSSLIDTRSMEWQWQNYVQLKTPLRRVLEKMLMAQPKNRFQSASEVLSAMQGLPTVQSPPQSSNQSKVPAAPSPWRDQPNKQLSGSVDSQRVSADPLHPSRFVEKCRQELSRRLGPIAHHLIDTILAQNPHMTRREFLTALTAHLPDPEQASQFVHQLQLPSGWLLEKPLFEVPVVSADHTTLPREYAENTLEAPGWTNSAPLDEAFINSCRLELARHIGPIATLLIQQTLNQNPHITAEALVETLAAKIPNSQLATQFQSQVTRLQ